MNVEEVAWVGLVQQARALEPDPELAEVDDRALEARVRDGAARIAAMTARWLLDVTEYVARGVWGEDGMRTPARWLSWACGVAPSTAREYVRVGIVLRQAPLIRQRFLAGTISYSKVRAITRVWSPELEPRLLELADAAPAAQLERIFAASRAALGRAERLAHGHEVDGQPIHRFERRQLDPDTVEFRLRMPVEEAAALEQRVDRLVDLADRQAAREPSGSQPGLIEATDDSADHTVVAEEESRERSPRTVRRVQAVSDALASAVAAGGPDRSGVDDHLVVLHVDAAELVAAVTDPASAEALDPASAEAPETAQVADARPAETAGTASAETPHARRRRFRVVTGRGRGMTLPRSVLARLTCDADLRLAGISDEDGCGGHPADIGRKSRACPADLRRALQLRDRSCRFPGCDARRGLHAHHVRHWADDGQTDLENLVLLCSFHHHLVHDAAWTMRPVDPAAGRWTYHRPDTDTPLLASRPLGGTTVTTPADIDAPPDALQPPFWDGLYDYEQAVYGVTELLMQARAHPEAPPDLQLAA